MIENDAMKKIIIMGATSAIAKAVARIYAIKGSELYLIARNEERLIAMQKDLKVRGAPQVHIQLLDVNNIEAHGNIILKAFAVLERVDIILIAHGSLPEQKKCQQDINLMLKALNTNAISTTSLLSLFANQLEAQKSGQLAVITSVAGDRGRQSNYIYGSAKGMVSIFLQGLRNRLHKSNVSVLDIKPGFIDTPMTAHIEKGALWAKPEVVAQSIVKAIDKKKYTLYTPSFWQLIMSIIKRIPEPVFKRLHL
jgi:short-subunit dehydrogenase